MFRHAHDREGGVAGFTRFAGDTEGTKTHYLSPFMDFMISFFSYLKKIITMLSKEQKHGILLFDEIILHESIAVKSSNLSYVGFEKLEMKYMHQILKLTMV